MRSATLPGEAEAAPEPEPERRHCRRLAADADEGPPLWPAPAQEPTPQLLPQWHSEAPAAEAPVAPPPQAAAPLLPPPAPEPLACQLPRAGDQGAALLGGLTAALPGSHEGDGWAPARSAAEQDLSSAQPREESGHGGSCDGGAPDARASLMSLGSPSPSHRSLRSLAGGWLGRQHDSSQPASPSSRSSPWPALVALVGRGAESVASDEAEEQWGGAPMRALMRIRGGSLDAGHREPAGAIGGHRELPKAPGAAMGRPWSSFGTGSWLGAAASQPAPLAPTRWWATAGSSA